MTTNVERLEARQLMSGTDLGATSLQIGNVLYTSDLVGGKGQLFKSNPDGSDKTLLKSWASVQPDQFFDLNSKLLFTAPKTTSSSGAHELWISDGTTAGTVLVKNFDNQPDQDEPNGFMTVNGLAIFQAWDGGNFDLWSTDGTTAGTNRLFATVTGIKEIGVSGNLFYFAGYGESPNSLAAVLQTDGTVAGTQQFSGALLINGDLQVYGSSGADNITFHSGNGTTSVDLNGNIQFFNDANFTTISIATLQGDDQIYLQDVAAPVTISNTAGTDGVFGLKANDTIQTSPGAFTTTGSLSVPLTDIAVTGGLRPTVMGTVGNTLYFMADDTSHQRWLWSTDATTSGTVKLMQLPNNSTYQVSWVNFNGTLYFTDGGDLWQIDQRGVTQIFDNATSTSGQLAQAGGKLYYATNFTPSQTESDPQLYVFDNPGAAPRQLSGFGPATGPLASYPAPTLSIVNGTLYFVSGGIWYTTDGQSITTLGITPGLTPSPASEPALPPAAQETIPDSITIGNTRYFISEPGNGTVELLADDGSGNVPKFIADLGGGLDVDPDGITYLNGRLIFAGKQMPTNTTNSVSDLLYYVDLASITPPTPPVTPPQTPSNQLSSMSFSKGTLSITGTSGDDQIILSRLPSDPSKLKVSFNGKTSVYKLSDVSQIVIHGGDGNDTIAFNEKSGKIAIASKIYGDAGNDNITGGSGVDRIYGGDGNDWIEGGGGNDVIYGEAGNDRLFGGAGRDHIDGGAGVNVLRGEDGVDSLFANAGDDLRGNKGDVLDQLQA